jgi:hypothetical protein
MRKRLRVKSRAFIVVILSFLSILLASEPFHIQGIYDFDGDGSKELVVQNSLSGNALELIEFSMAGSPETIWSWSANGPVMDFDVMDINQDGFDDLLAISDQNLEKPQQPWLYVFLGDKSGLSKRALEIYPTALALASIRPTSISFLEAPAIKIAVAFGSPIRKTAVFSLSITDNQVQLKDIEYLGTDLIQNGYSKLVSNVYRLKNQDYLLQISKERNTLKVAIFNGTNFEETASDVLISEARGQLLNGRVSFLSNSKGNKVVLPFDSGDVEFLQFDGEAFSLSQCPDGEMAHFTETNPSAFYKKLIEEEKNIKQSVTLADFINQANNDKEQATVALTKVPKILSEMTLGESELQSNRDKIDIVEADLIPENPILPPNEKKKIPALDKGLSVFFQEVKDSIKQQTQGDENLEILPSLDPKSIDLYFAQVMTPIQENTKRFIFDGESPFGVGAHAMPHQGKPSHILHNISANIAHLERGTVYDYAYSLRKARLDSITTISMVHDLQTNVVYLSISPSKDSINQSYEPSVFNPKLFEFPEYFFEGFPSAIGKNFTDQLIRFSFDDDTTMSAQTHGIYLSATSPSNPAQSLLVFLDQGELQAIRGEVNVRENGSKQVTTEFDLRGNIDPAVMFSRLIEEDFPDSLKIRLLQDGTFEEPLWQPFEKIQPISIAPSPPEELKGLKNPKIPIRADQSHVPDPDSLNAESSINPKLEETEDLLPNPDSPIEAIDSKDSSQENLESISTSQVGDFSDTTTIISLPDISEQEQSVLENFDSLKTGEGDELENTFKSSVIDTSNQISPEH